MPYPIEELKSHDENIALDTVLVFIHQPIEKLSVGFRDAASVIDTH